GAGQRRRLDCDSAVEWTVWEVSEEFEEFREHRRRGKLSLGRENHLQKMRAGLLSGQAMKALIRKTIFLLSVISIAGVAASAQTKPENLFNPPNWILGEWANHSGPEPNKIERISFSEHEIELVQSLADAGVKFSRKFKKYRV